jgi:hypothetical protein
MDPMKQIHFHAWRQAGALGPGKIPMGFSLSIAAAMLMSTAPNGKRSQAGPLALDGNREALQALADASRYRLNSWGMPCNIVRSFPKTTRRANEINLAGARALQDLRGRGKTQTLWACAANLDQELAWQPRTEVQPNKNPEQQQPRECCGTQEMKANGTAGKAMNAAPVAMMRRM